MLIPSNYGLLMMFSDVKIYLMRKNGYSPYVVSLYVRVKADQGGLVSRMSWQRVIKFLVVGNYL